MQKKDITFDCYFVAIGRMSQQTVKCFFETNNSEAYSLTLFTNNKKYENVSEINCLRYKPKPLRGQLSDGSKTYTNAKLSFVKRNQVLSTFGDVVSDVCYTDNGGRYTAYIQPGTYDIELFINNRKSVRRNQKIEGGLKFQYYFLVEGMISRKFKDTVSFYGTEYKNVYGRLCDNKGTPLENAEIIVTQDGDLCAYVKTDDDGNYRFALKNGTYVVKLRSDNAPVKSRTIVLDDLHGFTEQLIAGNNLFNKQDMIRL